MRNMIVPILRWFVVNAVLPMLIPVLFLATIDWIAKGEFPFWNYFELLFMDGFYIFSATSLVFSLLEDYREFKACTGPITITFLVILTIMTLGMFYTIRTNDPNYVAGHQSQFLWTWGISACFAIYVKGLILWSKIKLGKE